MGWLRVVGSLKLHVSFAKEPYKRDDILQKRPIIFRSLLIVAIPIRQWLLACKCVTHLNVSCHAYKWVMSRIQMRQVAHTNESCHIYKWGVRQSEKNGPVFGGLFCKSALCLWMKRSPMCVGHLSMCVSACVCVCVCVCVRECVCPRVQVDTSCLYACNTYKWVMSQIQMSHVTHPNESCHIYKWVMSHITMRHLTPTCESWHTYKWVIWHVQMSHFPHVNKSRQTYLWVISRIWIRHVTHVNESCHTYERVMCHIQMSHLAKPSSMSHIQRRHVTHTNKSWHAHERVMSHIEMTHVAHTIWIFLANTSSYTYEWVI